MSDEKIMYASDAAAKRVTVAGWLSADGRFWPDGSDPKFAEHHARWGGCTHLICECGNEHQKNYTICDACIAKKNDERYQAMEFKEWNGDPVCLYRDDTYFFSEDALEQWAEDNGIVDLSTIQLVICEPQYAWMIEGTDHYIDMLPEDTQLEEVAPKLAAAIEQVNEVISTEKEILCWMPGKFRTTYTALPTDPQKQGE